MNEKAQVKLVGIILAVFAILFLLIALGVINFQPLVEFIKGVLG